MLPLPHPPLQLPTCIVYILWIVLLSWGLCIMRGTGREQWFGVAKQRHVVGAGDCRMTGGGLWRWQGEIIQLGVYSEQRRRVSGIYKVDLI